MSEKIDKNSELITYYLMELENTITEEIYSTKVDMIKDLSNDTEIAKLTALMLEAADILGRIEFNEERDLAEKLREAAK